jgi:hypothetical protein
VTKRATKAATKDPIEHVRELLVAAERDGKKPPGRTVLLNTGATDYQIRTVKAELKVLATLQGTATGNDLELGAGSGRAATDGTGRATSDVNAREPRARRKRRVRTPRTRATPSGGKAVAWIGFSFGSVVSVAANVLAAWIAPEHAPAGWHPSIAAQVGAAVWPLGLLLAVEVVSRVPRPSTWTGIAALFGGIGVVASGSAVISYGHIRAVLESWAYSPLGAGVGPLVVDGLMMVCGVAMLAKPVRTPDPADETVRADVSAPVAEPAMPISYAALDIANRGPVAPLGDAWGPAVARLTEASARA